jgi:hypothetical protein
MRRSLDHLKSEVGKFLHTVRPASGNLRPTSSGRSRTGPVVGVTPAVPPQLVRGLPRTA